MWTQKEYESQIQSIQQKYVKIQILNWNEEIIDEISGVCLSGAIQIDATQIVRRTLDISFVLDNPNLIPSTHSKLWLNTKIKVLIGIKNINDEIKWFNKGIFILFKPTLKFSANDKTISFQALDKMCWLNGQLNGNLQSITKISANTTLFEAIKTTIQQLGGENKFIIDDLKDDSGRDLLIPFNIEKTETNNVADILTDIKELYMDYEFYYDEKGRFHYEKIKNHKDDIIMWDFTNSQQMVIDYNNEPNWENIRNDIMIWGATLENGTQIKYHIQNTDNNSPFNIYSNIGIRKGVYQNQNIRTIEQAKIQGGYELFKHSNLLESVNLSIIPIYILDVNQKVKINKKEIGINGDYIIDKLTIPLDISSNMNITSHKIHYQN